MQKRDKKIVWYPWYGATRPYHWYHIFWCNHTCQHSGIFFFVASTKTTVVYIGDKVISWCSGPYSLCWPRVAKKGFSQHYIKFSSVGAYTFTFIILYMVTVYLYSFVVVNKNAGYKANCPLSTTEKGGKIKLS